MNPPFTNLLIPPFSTRIPAPIYFRVAQVPASATYPVHRHPWGEFVYSFSGVIEVKMADNHFIAPPQYGIWLPPDIEHIGLNRQQACHASLYISRELCADFPAQACALTLTPLIRAVLDELCAAPPHLPQSEEDARLLQVLVDRLRRTPREGTYLPGSNDPLLAPILEALEKNPGDDRSLGEWAKHVNATERTLLRRCQRDLGMSLVQWKQRLKVVASLEKLREGMAVEHIALDLGYSSSSAFISMFRKLTGESPDEYRRSRLL